MGYGQRRQKGDYRWVPDTSGIYRLYQGDRVVYVGQTSDLAARLRAHERDTPFWGTYDFKSTRGTPTRQRHRMEERSIVYNRPTRNRR